MEWIAVTLAFVLVFPLSMYALRQGYKVRAGESEKNKDYDPVSAAELGWHFTHIRDDVAGIALLLATIASFLAANVFVLVIIATRV